MIRFSILSNARMVSLFELFPSRGAWLWLGKDKRA
jgi:hypothetical protein